MRLYESAAAQYPETRGRCVSCGFLAKRRDRWHEASTEDRASGRFGQAGTGYEGEINTWPACFRRAADLRAEYEARMAAGLAREPATVQVLSLDRNCPEWYPYTPGFSPKEHLEELRMMQIEEDRKQHDLALAQLQAEAEKRGLDIAQAVKGFTTTWTYVAVVVAVIAVLVVAATWLFPDRGRQFGDFLLGPATTAASPAPRTAP